MRKRYSRSNQRTEGLKNNNVGIVIPHEVILYCTLLPFLSFYAHISLCGSLLDI